MEMQVLLCQHQVILQQHNTIISKPAYSTNAELKLTFETREVSLKCAPEVKSQKVMTSIMEKSKE